jgi:hypothetical protein
MQTGDRNLAMKMTAWSGNVGNPHLLYSVKNVSEYFHVAKVD